MVMDSGAKGVAGKSGNENVINAIISNRELNICVYNFFITPC
jgi:hypothetical protein